MDKQVTNMMSTLLLNKTPQTGCVYAVAKHTKNGLKIENIVHPESFKHLIKWCKEMSKESYEHVPVILTTLASVLKDEKKPATDMDLNALADLKYSNTVAKLKAN